MRPRSPSGRGLETVVPRSSTVTRTACTICRAPTSGSWLCRGDLGILARDLADVADLVADLEVTTSRQHRTAPASSRKGGLEIPLPWGQGASAAHRRLADVLAAEVTRAGVKADGPAPAAAVLRRALPVLKRDPGIGEFAEALRDAVAHGRKVIDTPEVRSRFAVGPCPQTVADPADPTTEVACRGTVRAHVGAAHRPSTLECPTCQETWSMAAWWRVGGRILAREDQQQGAPRELAGVCVPYDRPIRVNATLVESFRPGVFGNPGAVPLFLRHNERDRVRVGSAIDSVKSPAGLWIHWLIDRSPAGDEALAMVDSGEITGCSPEFREVRNRTRNGVTERRRARLIGVALVPDPAFGNLVEVRRPSR